MKRVVALIPARGGSKGIPRKNLKPLAGKPLLQYTVESALSAKSITNVFLTTDSEEIADCGRKLGVQVPFLRPSEIAADETPMIEVVRHFLEWMKAAQAFSEVTFSCGVGLITMDGSGVLHPDLAPYVGNKLAPFSGHTRADSLNLEQIGEQLIQLTPHNDFSLTCKSTPFYDRNVLLPNGDVVLCCMDYNLTHILGNLLTQTYEEVMQGKPLQDLIDINEEPEFNKCSICKSCENVTRLC